MRRGAKTTWRNMSIISSSVFTLIDQIAAAETIAGKVSYDLPEPNDWDMYQDFGHSHWQNSLIWGIGLENVSMAKASTRDWRAQTLARMRTE